MVQNEIVCSTSGAQRRTCLSPRNGEEFDLRQIAWLVQRVDVLKLYHSFKAFSTILVWLECKLPRRRYGTKGRRGGKQQKLCELYSGAIWEYLVDFKIGRDVVILVTQESSCG